MPDIVWDGNVPFWHYLAGIPENRGIYVGANAGSADDGSASFMDLDVIPFFTLSWFHSPSTDLPDHPGGVDALPGATLPAEQEEKARTL